MSSESPWSLLQHTFLHEGDWAIGQGVDAPDRKALRAVLEALLVQWGGVSMLEVGPGAGIELEGLRRDGLLDQINYVGYDMTPEFVVHCQELFPEARFETRDVDSLEDEEIADLVWARHVVEHVQDPYSVIERLWRASCEATLISWFIRPTFRPEEVGCGIADGFRHWHLDAREAIGFVADLGAQLRRYDFDHHGTQASLWVLVRRANSRILSTLDKFFFSQEFLDALLPVPPVDRTREQALEEVIADAAGVLAIAADYLDATGRSPETRLRLRESQQRCEAAIAKHDEEQSDD